MGKKSKSKKPQRDDLLLWDDGSGPTKAKEKVSAAARKAIRRDITAINVLAKACDELQKEWRVYVSRPWAWGRVKATEQGLTWLFLDGIESLATLRPLKKKRAQLVRATTKSAAVAPAPPAVKPPPMEHVPILTVRVADFGLSQLLTLGTHRTNRFLPIAGLEPKPGKAEL